MLDGAAGTPPKPSSLRAARLAAAKYIYERPACSGVDKLGTPENQAAVNSSHATKISKKQDYLHQDCPSWDNTSFSQLLLTYGARDFCKRATSGQIDTTEGATRIKNKPTATKYFLHSHESQFKYPNLPKISLTLDTIIDHFFAQWATFSDQIGII